VFSNYGSQHQVSTAYSVLMHTHKSQTRHATHGTRLGTVPVQVYNRKFEIAMTSLVKCRYAVGPKPVMGRGSIERVRRYVMRSATLCPIHTADATQLSSWVASAVCRPYWAFCSYLQHGRRGHRLSGSGGCAARSTKVQWVRHTPKIWPVQIDHADWEYCCESLYITLIIIASILL